MNEDYEGNVDPVAEGTERAAAEVPEEDLAKEIEGEEKEAKDDLTDEQFEYEAADGTKYQGTINEIIAKMTETAGPAAGTVPPELQTKIAELEAKLEAALKPGEVKAGEETEDIQPVDWTKTGNILAERLGINPEEMDDGERKMLGEIGPLMNDAIHRTVLTSPHIRVPFEQFIIGTVQKVLAEKEGKSKTESAFDQFIGEEKFTDQEVAEFQKGHPFANTREMAIMGLKMQRQAAGTTKEKGETDKKVKEAAAKTKKQFIETQKAAGKLKLLGTGGGARAGVKSGKQKLEGDDRVSAALDKLRQIRSQ